MTRTPPAPSANADLALTMREICAQLTARADAAILFGPLLHAIAALVARLFSRLETMLELWRAGILPAPPAAAPRQRKRSRQHAGRSRHSRVRRVAVIAPALRRRPAWFHPAAPVPGGPGLSPRRIDRYPKSA